MNKLSRFFIVTILLLSGIGINTKVLLAGGDGNKDAVEEALLKLSESHSTGNWDTLYVDALHLLQLAKAENRPFYKAKSNYYLGAYFSNIMEYDSSIRYFQNAKKAYLSCRDTLNMGIIATYIGLEYKKKGDIENALLNYNKGSDLLEMVGDTIWYGFVNNQMGMIYFYQGNYILALKHLQRSLKAFDKSGNLINAGITSNTLGIVYRKTNDKQKEEKAYLDAIRILESMDASFQLGQAYNNLSEVYLDKGEVEKGFEILEKARTIFESTNYPLGLCSYYAVLSYYHLETLKPPNYDKVIDYCLKSLKIAEEYEDFRQYADVTSFLGTAYIETDQLEKAKRILKKGLSIAKAYNYKHEIVKITEVLASVYEKDNQPEKALEYLRDYIALKDSIVGEEKIKEFTQMDLEFKLNQQQIRDSLKYVHSNLEKDFQHRKEIQAQKQSTLILTFISLLFVVIAFFVFINARINKKQVKVLSEKNAQISEQKIEIETYATQIQEAYIKLQDLDEYKQAMTNMLVHDLKNPLNLLVNLEVVDNEQEMRSIVNRTGKQMLNMIMNLLDISKAEHNTLQLNKADVLLNEVINSSIYEVDYLCDQKSITIQNMSSENYTLKADKDILLRIFINFLTNAIKFSPSGSTIFYNTEITGDKLLRISLKDTGIGIAKKHQEIIFEKFRQVNVGEVGSTGLGLAFCKMAVESHGWTIGVESEPGKGAEFWIAVKHFRNNT